MTKSAHLLCSLIVASLCIAAGTLEAQTRWFSAQLSGANEVGNPGDDDGWGLGVVRIGSDSVAYYIWVTDISSPTAAHIHTGSAGVNGGIAINFEVAFTDNGDGSYVAFGEIAADPGTLSSVLADPTAFYFNVHNGDHPTGAVRGQVLGGGSAESALAGTLNGTRQVDNPGDPDGEGFATVIFDDGTAHFYFNVTNTVEPSAAHIHRGTANENGSIAINPSADFTAGVAVASVDVDADLEREILGAPHKFYFNVHTPEFAAGAVRGQIRATETVRVFPVVSRIDGRKRSLWRTGLNVANINDAEMTAWASWFPANHDGLTAADDTVAIAIAAGATEVVGDAVNDLFGTDGNGALILAAPEPFASAAHVFNDQRENPTVSGTFGLFVPSFDPSTMPESGILLLAANHPSSPGSGFRSNIVLFNPNPFPVDVTLSANSAGGDELGSDSMTLEPFMNTVEDVFQLIPSVPSELRDQDAFTVSYSASAPVAVNLTPVDNATNDGFFVVPSFAPPVKSTSAANSPPNGTILSPSENVTIQAGGMVNFEGSAEDPDGDDMSYLWNFGDGITTTALVPGNHTYTDSGTYTVTFTVTDSNGAVDPTPDTRIITVEGGGGQATFSAVQSQIFTPSCAFSGCHAGGSPAQGMNLSQGQAYANIVNVASNQQPSLDRIEPDNPEASYLYLKVTGDASSGGQMPPGGGSLSQDLLDLLRDWIERGAPDD